MKWNCFCVANPPWKVRTCFFFCVGGTLGNLFATIPHWDFSRFGAWLLRHVPFKERWGLIQWTTLGAQLQGKNRWEIVEASEVLFT